FEAIRRGFESAIEKGDQLQDIAEKFGVSASKLQTLGNAASVYGSSIEAVSAGLNKLSLAQQKATSGDEGLIATFKEVGVSIEDLKSMGPEDIFLKISDSFASGANDGRQFVLVNELLGKAQTDLIKVMNQGSTAIIDQGNAMGVWSDETISSLSAASDTIKTLQNLFTVAFGNIASFLTPAINASINAYQKFIEVIILAGAASKEVLAGNFDGAKLLAKEINRIIDEDRSARPLGAGGPKTVGEQASDESTKAAEAAAKKTKDEQEKMMDLYRQADAVRRRQMLNAMSDEDKLQALMQERADLMNKINKTPEGVDRAKLALEQANLDAQIGPLQTKVQADIMKNMIGSEVTAKVASSRTEPMQILADSLQRVGGGGNFARVGGAEAVQKDQLTALKSIDKGITKLANQTSITSADTGVQ
ncbi:MAG: hypothetical protein EBU96_06835, partial [Actinobacteria bacterium]|nr:hypothetical protein [Actinomycetota bacterium]